ncbi:Retinoic acid induced 16-like protein [Teratosphaeria destructans]|uniref:Retinoic acid induced 16-like protein n=1 Tax=Teratosphaeria destructans TaxID=418781 RepID=A0A9W7W409_9PEZI|nr:Retinoic acid induced 16-like protein [Teratosphaeria destructans]
MDFLARLLGGSAAPKKVTRPPANDPQARLVKFKRLYHNVLEICNQPRNFSTEWPVLQQLRTLQECIAAALQEESRSPAPHLCLQFCASNRVYAVIGRAAAVSQDEGVIRSAITIFDVLTESDEGDFVSSEPFAKSLTRLVTRVADVGGLLLGVESEVAIFQLLFNISAKLRQQPDVLPIWFHSSIRGADIEDIFTKDSTNFTGATRKDDFILCYLLLDRLHHEGKIGDFARTGLLYILAATRGDEGSIGRQLADWIVLSDLPALVATGLGALYSQLSRELSILHPDATLPAVLAMSDYSTNNPRPNAESAFSDRHQAHMSTFLAYLTFWQDVLDHCSNSDVRQSLLDHFQILFVQQLLYPSVLQSSDTDAGSSVAVLTYITAMLESLEYPDIIRMLLNYLLDVKDEPAENKSVPASPTTPEQTPRSPNAIKSRQSLMLLTAPEDPNNTFEPSLFNLVDLILNSIDSRNDQTSFAALKLLSTMMARQKRYAYDALLKPQKVKPTNHMRTAGALTVEIEKYSAVAVALHVTADLGDCSAYTELVEDVRFTIEAQALHQPAGKPTSSSDANCYLLSNRETILRRINGRLRTFFTNSVDVNLALTEAIVSIASCIELRLDAWLALDPASYSWPLEEHPRPRSWQGYLDEEERDGWFALQEALRSPTWSDANAPLLYRTVQALIQELDTVHAAVPNLQQLLAGRQNMLQAAGLDNPASSRAQPSLFFDHGPAQASAVDAITAKTSQGHSRSSSASSIRHGRGRGPSITATASPLSRSLAASPAPVLVRPSDISRDDGGSPAARSIYQPPPPEAPSTTDVLMQTMTFPAIENESGEGATNERTASLNHVLTNIVVLQEFVLELIAVLQVRAAVLGEREVRIV